MGRGPDVLRRPHSAHIWNVNSAACKSWQPTFPWCGKINSGARGKWSLESDDQLEPLTWSGCGWGLAFPHQFGCPKFIFHVGAVEMAGSGVAAALQRRFPAAVRQRSTTTTTMTTSTEPAPPRPATTRADTIFFRSMTLVRTGRSFFFNFQFKPEGTQTRGLRLGGHELNSRSPHLTHPLWCVVLLRQLVLPVEHPSRALSLARSLLPAHPVQTRRANPYPGPAELNLFTCKGGPGGRWRWRVSGQPPCVARLATSLSRPPAAPAACACATSVRSWRWSVEHFFATRLCIASRRVWACGRGFKPPGLCTGCQVCWAKPRRSASTVRARH